MSRKCGQGGLTRGPRSRSHRYPNNMDRQSLLIVVQTTVRTTTEPRADPCENGSGELLKD